MVRAILSCLIVLVSVNARSMDFGRDHTAGAAVIYLNGMRIQSENCSMPFDEYYTKLLKNTMGIHSDSAVGAFDSSIGKIYVEMRATASLECNRSFVEAFTDDFFEKLNLLSHARRVDGGESSGK